ncbi:MAG: sulfatase-like hydrolase/transferase [Planctomycetaceae bacterium]|jgi:arylsulfatase A-like enzyme|nr:sulfatase-like hydrolase/transferase [Planctomycetaceae bacterium]
MKTSEKMWECILIGLTIMCTNSFVFAAELSKPNVLIILVDDLGYGDLSIYGGTDVKTPNIDSLGIAGMKFTQFRANCSVCSPSRASLLSGMFPDRAGVPGVIRTHAEDSWGYLAQNLTLLPAALKKHSYESTAIGKWHLGLESPNLPNERGFDFFHGFLGDMMDDYYNHRRHNNNYLRRNSETIDPQGHATDIFSDWACDYLRDQAKETATAKKPFFLYLAYNAPHAPIQPPQEFLDRVLKREPQIDEKRTKLVALIEHLDAGIGHVLQTLKETGLDQNTLVVFTSDNGGQLNLGASNGSHRGGKGEMYEGGLKIPFLVRWQNHIAPSSQTEVQGVLMDLFPTVLEIAGATPGDHSFVQRIDGISLLNVFLGKSETLESRNLYFVRREGGIPFGGKTSNALIRGDWKILQNTPFSPLEFYNLKNDPLETTDLKTKAPQELRTSLKQIMLNIQEGGRVPWQTPH